MSSWPRKAARSGVSDPMPLPRCTSSRSAAAAALIRRDMRVAAIVRMLVLAACALVTAAASASADNSPDEALRKLLADAHLAAETQGACDRPGSDRLVRVICAG